MIRPITKPVRERRILTYDMEWFPGTLELRLIGVFDGSEYRSYKTPLEFLQGELTTANSGAWFFAHAGGLADLQFLLQVLVDRGYCVKAAFSGSSAIIVEISDGNKKWLLIDSFWLLRSPLKKIGEAVGIKKLKDYICPGSSMVKDPISGKDICDGAGCDHPPPEDPSDPWCIFYASMPELKTYNEQDNRILWTAIVQLQDSLMDMGSELCMTQASSAMKLYRRVYLNRDIRTHKSINERARVSYVGSRVEVYAPYCDEADYYDINSSFPYAMTFPAPGSLRGGKGSLPTGESEMFLADVEIEVPDMYLPPIPWRHPKEHRVYFPTGRWRTWLWGIDVRLLEAMGGKILKCHRSMEFDHHRTLEAYARDLYSKRKASTTEFEKMLYKLLLNSLYGKFGESPLKQAAYFHPESAAGMNLVMPGVYMAEEIQDIEHEHVPISTHITAFARRTLYRFNKLCLDLGGKLFYNDSVAGDRCLVVRDPRGRTHVMPVERLWDRHAQNIEERFDGKEEASLAGWTALSRSLETGKEGFLPIRSVIRHRAGKKMHLVSTKEGQTEITSDHGIMVRGPEGLVEATADEFVQGGHHFEQVRPEHPGAWSVLQLHEELENVVYKPTEDCEVRFSSRDGWIQHDLDDVRYGNPKIRDFYSKGSPELHALLRLVGAFVSEGSSSFRGEILGDSSKRTVRDMFSICQKDRTRLEGLQRDLKVVMPDLHTSIFETDGVHVLRSGSLPPALLFAGLCGKGSENKRLPRFCLDLSKEDFQVLWEKLLEGDGHAHWEGYSTYTTKSRELASQLSYLLHLHGIDHAHQYRPSKKVWVLRTRSRKARPGRVVRHEVREARPDEYVYDLSVEGGGTFVDAMGCVLLKNTDSCVTTISPDRFDPNYDWIPGFKGIIGDELGQMKHEYHVHRGQFVAPKIYMLDATNMEKLGKAKKKGYSDEDAEAAARSDVIRAKGFSRMTTDKFKDLIAGREIEIRRMSRVRELLNKGQLTPYEAPIRKRLQIEHSDDGELKFKMRSKRQMLVKENDSRPWNIKELFNGDPMVQLVQ